MKITFFLYFLVLSPLIFSQNSYHSDKLDYKNNPIFDLENIILTSKRNLTIIDKGSATDKVRLWLNPVKDSVSTNEQIEFSSIELLNRLEDLNSKTPFHISHNPTLERFIRHFLKTRREELSNIMDRSAYYFPVFDEYLDKYDIPLEIKYLAVIESALHPNANSSSGAKGLWQFMLGTGKEYNLNVNSYVDDRYDPVKSTEAACKYLKKLYIRFNDWDLALAAYNSGPGNVNKAIKRAGGKRNYWEIRQYLPQETRGYVPAFYATYYIFEYANDHGLRPAKSELSFIEVDTIHVKKSISFASIQKKIKIDYQLLKALNPQYKKDYIPLSGSNPYVLTLPVNLALDFVENQSVMYQLTSEARSQFSSTASLRMNESNSYRIREGDNLKRIAKKHQISVEQLKKWNGLQTDYVIVDQRLVITDKIKSDIMDNTYSNPTKLNSVSTNISYENTGIEVTSHFSENSNLYETYIVKEGDTLFKISRKYIQVSIEQLREWNDLNDSTFLKPGTKLKIIKS